MGKSTTSKSKSMNRKGKSIKSKSNKSLGKTKHNRSAKNVSNDKKSHLVHVFFEMLNTVKLYHWKTKSYAQHKATDELYERLNENIDKFVEVLLGKDESRIKMIEKRITVVDYSNVSDFKDKIYKYRDFLLGLNKHFNEKKDSDLLSVRDDILVDINQFLYLMTFN
jgi:DNA-binding ferritin-like protein